MGDPMLYDIYVAIDAYFQDEQRLSTRPCRVQLLRKLITAKEIDASVSSKTEEAQTNDKAELRKRNNGRGSNHRKDMNHYPRKHVEVAAVRQKNKRKSVGAKETERWSA